VAKKKTVTKKEIVAKIAADPKLELTQLEVKAVVLRIFSAIVDTLLTLGRIELRNFGVFEVKLRKARKARNPRTSETVYVEPKFVVTFKPGKEMEEKVKELHSMRNPPEFVVKAFEKAREEEDEEKRGKETEGAHSNGAAEADEALDGKKSPKRKKAKKAAAEPVNPS